MKTILLSCLVCVSLVSSALGQVAAVDVSVAKMKAIAGINAARVVEGAIIVSDDSKPVVTQVAILTVTTKAKFVRVKARKSLFEFGQVSKIGDSEWLLSGSGRYAVEVTAFDPELGIDEKVIDVELGEDPTPPGPGPGPDPGPVPPDAFDNLGQRIAKASAGLPKRAEVAAVYRSFAKQLREEPLITVATAVEGAAKQRTSLLAGDAPKWNAFAELLTEDLKKRWPMAKGTLADYFDCIVVGLEAK